MKTCLCNNGGALMAQILAVQPDEYIEPKMADGTFEPLEPRMNEFEKQAFTVAMRIEQTLIEKSEAINGGHLKSSEAGIIRSEIRILYAQRDRAMEQMFFSIHDRLSCWDKELDVSKGWKIIIPEEREHTRVIEVGVPLGDLLATLLQAGNAESGGGPKRTASGGLDKDFKVRVSGPNTMN
jgi:hypothetical protein